MDGMSAVIAAPQLMAEAATNWATIAATLDAAHLTAASPTRALLPAAADEVSASVAQLFSGYAADYHELAERAAGYHQEFVQHLATAAGAYAGAEAANVSLLQPSGPTAAALPSFDQILAALTPLFWNTVALLYYSLFALLVPIYGALAIYLPFAFLGSLFAL